MSPPPNTARRSTPEESREEILAAAEQLLRAQSLSDLSVGAVMARTRLGRSSFYVYFVDMDDLVIQLSQRVEQRLWPVAERWLDASDPAEGLSAALKALVDVWAEHGPVLHAIGASAATNARVAEIWREGLVERFVRAAAKQIAHQVAAGRTPPVPPYETAAALILMNERFLMDRFGRGRTGDRETAAAALIAIWQGVLYPPPA